ncbi:hypothetical protein SDC9_139167 [bioreactor metagenome]|uniref:Uncharacterized protein n=1 Tax=bioreactor metagenome TaxID=1076179 RepID=A0A645DTW4_9ZZZZ
MIGVSVYYYLDYILQACSLIQVSDHPYGSAFIAACVSVAVGICNQRISICSIGKHDYLSVQAVCDSFFQGILSEYRQDIP